MPAARAPIRRRFFLGGVGAITGAVLLSGVVDRALVLAGLPPPARFALAAAAMLVVLVVPLMWSLERWVIRPIEALDGLHAHPRPPDAATLHDRALPREVAEIIHQHTTLVTKLSTTNERLVREVQRRTEVQEVLIAAADALSRLTPDRSPAETLLPIVARLEPRGAAASVLREDDRWVLAIRPPAPVADDAVAAIETKLLRVLGRDHRLAVRWLPPAQRSADSIHTLRILVRWSVPGAGRVPSPAALVLLSTGSGEGHAAREDLQRVLGTIGTWIARVRPDSVARPLPRASGW